MLQNLAHAHASSFNFGIGTSRIFRNIFPFKNWAYLLYDQNAYLN